MRIILIGPPGAGKGTQSAMMAEAFQIPHLSTGEILRAATAEQTEVGLEAAKYMDRGDLVPDEMIQKMVFQELSKPGCERGYILDGFPRTLPQAEEFDRWLTRHERALALVLKFSVTEDILLERLDGRGRIDDDREVVKKRMDRYLALTKPLVDYYQDRGVLRRIQGGVGTAEEVFDEIQKIVASLPSQQPANKS